MKIKISKLLLSLNSNSKYTEEYSYNNSGEYPIIDGSTQNFQYKFKINTFDYDNDILSISTVGYYAGHVNIYNGKCSIGNNVACFILTNYAISLGLDINYLAFKIFQITKNIISGESGGYSALNINKFLSSYIEIDNEEKRTIIVDFMKKRQELFLLENKINIAVENMKKYNLNKIEGNTYPINRILDLVGGSSELTQEYLYNNSDQLDDLLPVYTGAISFNNLFVNRKNVEKIFKNSLKITRKGLAGHILYVPGEFTINDDAYVVKIKDEFLSNVNIHFLHFCLSSVIEDAVSSKCGNGTFNKTKFLTFEIKLPSKNKQNEYGKIFYEYLKLIEISEKMRKLRVFLNKELYNLEL